MPEGPEVRRAADEIAQRMQGEVIERVEFGIKRLIPRAEDIEGRTIESIDTFGKATVTNLSGGLHIYSHNMLYGRWILTRHGEDTRTKKEVKMGLHTASYSLQLYSTKSVDVLDTDDLPEHKYLSKLGPDVLLEELTEEDVIARLKSATFKNKALGAILLDQSFLAGIGNYLRSEILLWSKLHHTRNPAELSTSELATLAEQILGVSKRSYDSGGATAGNYLTLPKGERADFDNFEFIAYKQEGKPCPFCGSEIELVEYQKRNVYICPSCQESAPR